MIRAVMLTLIVVISTGCWNGENQSIHLGDVSLGQQLIDLKAALDADALTQEEYDTAHALLLSGADLCADDDED